MKSLHITPMARGTATTSTRLIGLSRGANASENLLLQDLYITYQAGPGRIQYGVPTDSHSWHLWHLCVMFLNIWYFVRNNPWYIWLHLQPASVPNIPVGHVSERIQRGFAFGNCANTRKYTSISKDLKCHDMPLGDVSSLRDLCCVFFLNCTQQVCVKVLLFAYSIHAKWLSDPYFLGGQGVERMHRGLVRPMIAKGYGWVHVHGSEDTPLQVKFGTCWHMPFFRKGNGCFPCPQV